MASPRTTVDDLVQVARRRAVDEANEWAVMVRFRDAELARLVRIESPMRRLIEQSTIAVEIGQAMGMSEGQVLNRLAQADRILEFAPRTWLAFQTGDIDGARAREIANTLGRLERLESKQRLDATVVGYAANHTVAELRQWLKRFITRTEADLALARAEDERAKRHVSVTHVDDGMAWINAYLPSHQAAAIANRLRHEAKALAPDDTRTREQRQADLLVEHVLSTPAGDGTAATMRMDIGVTLDARTLVGLDDGYAESPDGTWEVPAGWILDSPLVSDTFWHRLLVDPIIGDTLAHQYVGYAPPAALRKAIEFRDGVCATPGCLKPAAECDLDHRQPWPEGPTSGGNLDPQCRGDHARKGHGTLTRVLHAHHARSRPDHRVRYRTPEIDLSQLEQDYAWRLVDDSLE